MQSAVGAPITVDGRLWGALIVGSVQPEPLPADTEARMARFAELVATAISNVDARAALQRLADEQAALRRVATLVARQSSPAETLTSIAREVATLLGADVAAILRYEPDQTVSVVAGWGHPDIAPFVGRRLPADGDSPTAKVRETARPARRDDWADAEGELAELNRKAGVTCSVAGPVKVDAQLWGTLSVSTTEAAPLPPDTEARIAQFSELVATAISNVKTRSELIDSRARIVDTADRTRQRIERDLHDGVQQRLVSIGLELRGVEAALPDDLELPRERLSQAVTRLTEALDDVRELSQGLHPAVLMRGGLEPALRALARRSKLPVRLDLHVSRLSPKIEVAAYFVVSEMLANAAKHARASVITVQANTRDRRLEVLVADDGRGGADPTCGSGLFGLIDRVDALGGRSELASPPGEGTSLRIRLPLDSA